MNTTQKGTYILILYLASPAYLTIGKHGDFDFAAGWYAYVGSAFGSGGLRGRLNHHLKIAAKPHWHIDYLRQAAELCEVWYLPDERRYEHEWAALLGSMSYASVPVPRFGASDCRCPSHLFHFEQMPNYEAFRKAVKLPVNRDAVHKVWRKGAKDAKVRKAMSQLLESASTP